LPKQRFNTEKERSADADDEQIVKAFLANLAKHAYNFARTALQNPSGLVEMKCKNRLGSPLEWQ
jgi:hypothetical protein